VPQAGNADTKLFFDSPKVFAYAQKFRVAPAFDYLMTDGQCVWTRFEWRSHVRALELCVLEIETALQKPMPGLRTICLKAKSRRPKFARMRPAQLVALAGFWLSQNFQDEVIWKRLLHRANPGKLTPTLLAMVELMNHQLS
jgi:hypothetical protein